ncbi:hypothetical protein V6N13_112505 [Hibiscus sabdariffa]
MERLNPHAEGGVVYEEVSVSASTFSFFDYEADEFWPHGISHLHSFKLEDSFSCKTEDILSDIEDMDGLWMLGRVKIVLSGRKAIKFDAGDNDDHRHIIPWANEHIKKGTFYRIIDPYLRRKIAPSCLGKFLEIALSCVHVQEHKRPALGEVETTLELALELQNRADSEMECLNPHGEVEYEAQLVPALLALNFSDFEVQAFWPCGSSSV